MDASTKHKNHAKNTSLPLGLPRRYTRLLLAILISVALWFSTHRSLSAQSDLADDEDNNDAGIPFPHIQEISNDTDHKLPPSYESYKEYEDLLSERNLLLQNDTPRYIFFANQATGCGWGNVLQEVVFNALLASEANLGYVWDDYTWSKQGEYSTFNGKTIPSRIPMSTMLAGHMLGNFSEHLPSSISSRAYSTICPPHERSLIDRDMVQAYLRDAGSPIDLQTASGKEILDGWVSFLKRPEFEEARCIEVKEATFPPFDIWLLGSTRVQSVWNRLYQSPVLQKWDWSPLIRGAFQKNIATLATRADAFISPTGRFLRPLWTYFGGNKHPSCSAENLACIPNPRFLDDSTPLPVLVLHLRRGDFSEHCANLAEWNSTYTGFNSFPQSQARDRFVPPIIGDVGDEVDAEGPDPVVVKSMDAKKRVYAQHCFPDVSQIVRRVREVVLDYVRMQEEKERHLHWWTARPEPQKMLRKVYIMTNGDPMWLAGVKEALLDDLPRRGESSGRWEVDWTWEEVSTSRDLQLGWEEKPVAQALDVYTAQRAELFIGNGFSSLTSNIVMLRMKNDFDPVQTRFW